MCSFYDVYGVMPINFLCVGECDSVFHYNRDCLFSFIACFFHMSPVCTFTCYTYSLLSADVYTFNDTQQLDIETAGNTNVTLCTSNNASSSTLTGKLFLLTKVLLSLYDSWYNI